MFKNSPKSLRFTIFTLFFLTAWLSSLFGQSITLTDQKGYLDVPVGWRLLSKEKKRVVFVNQEQSAYFMASQRPVNNAKTAQALFAEISDELEAQSSRKQIFAYFGLESCFGQVEFSADSYAMRGFLLVIKSREQNDIALLAFSDAQAYAVHQDTLLSFMDSYAIDSDSLAHPGPLTILSLSAKSTGRAQSVVVEINEKKIDLTFDANILTVTNEAIARELRVLNTLPANQSALQRFYRSVYRITHTFLDPLLAVLAVEFPRTAGGSETKRQFAAWLNAFERKRTTIKDPTDFNPLAAIFGQPGTPHSIGLLLTMLVRHRGNQAYLLVSASNNETRVAIAGLTEGAGFVHEGQNYAVASINQTSLISFNPGVATQLDQWVAINFLF